MRDLKTYYFFLVLIFLSILESTVWPINLVFLALVIWSFVRDSKEVLITAFFAGLVLDFLAGSPLGEKSILFLVILALVLIFRFRFFSKGSLATWQILPFLLASVFLGSLFLSIASNSFESKAFIFAVFWPQFLQELILALVLYPIFEFLSRRWQREGIQLQLKV